MLRRSRSSLARSSSVPLSVSGKSEASAQVTPPFDLLVCGPVWVDYILYLSSEVRTGESGAIEAEVREAGGWGWQVAHQMATAGWRVGLWCNTPLQDPNGRVFTRALEELPSLILLPIPQPEGVVQEGGIPEGETLKGETPYCVTLRTPTNGAFFAATRLWRNQAGTRVPHPLSEALPLARAALYIGPEAPTEPWLLRWRESRITLTEMFLVSGDDDPVAVQDAVRWAQQSLL